MDHGEALPQVPVLPSNSVLPTWGGVDQKNIDNPSLFSRLCTQQQQFAGATPTYKVKTSFDHGKLQARKYDRLVHYRHPQPSHWPKTEYEYERDARKLYREFLTCSGYQNYRNRQPKKGKKAEKAVWPDELEHAFFRG